MNIYKPTFDEISVIIQGPLDQKINFLIKSIIEKMSESEIIISTWENNIQFIENEYLDKVVIIESSDLKSVYIDPITTVEDNLHRQIHTTNIGLKKSTKKYSLKLRSDCSLINTNFLEISDISEEFSNLLNKKITISSLGFVNPLKIPFLGYWSDFFMFGETVDLIKYWTINIELNYKSSYLNLIKQKFYFNNSGFLLARYGCEQQLSLNIANHLKFNIKLNSKDDFSFDSAYKFEKISYNIFNLINYNETGITLPRRLEKGQFNKNFYTKKEFEELRKYIQSELCYKYRYEKLSKRKYYLTLINTSFYKGILLIILYPFMRFLNIKLRIRKK
ncbi:hypothetical protein O8C83_06420 [Aliarcobacter butzleri]|uniref:WavE lipopolysaccharide synthesis family protein n=1 Tax=Aliarcobacter butzleri TaxID=28197 RepID=UPI00263DEDFF|nr:WavE lipopolysaccharide synthesis family protein [Aliarcobacter butzleri]MDN5100454.1 hypothetical protein [Aliarcobacter butzleri]